MFLLKKNPPTFCCFKKKLYLCIAIEKNNGSIAQLNRAFDYGSKGYRFESYWSHSEAREGQSHDWPSFFCIPSFTIHHSPFNIQHSTFNIHLSPSNKNKGSTPTAPPLFNPVVPESIIRSVCDSEYAWALRVRGASACWPHTHCMSPRRRTPGYRPRRRGCAYRYGRGTSGHG